MNTVLLTGQLTSPDSRGLSVPEGWQAMRLHVRRRGIGGRREPGLVAVTLLVPPKLAQTARQRCGQLVGVVGMLDVEDDEAGPSGLPRAAVVAESIEELT